MSADSGDEQNLGHFHCRNRLCMITRTSTTIDELRHVIDHRQLSLHATGMQQLVQNSTSCNCGSSAVSSTSALENCWTCTTNIDHLVIVLQRENFHGFLNRTKETASAPRQRCRRPAQLECPQTARRTESEEPLLCANTTSLHDTGTSTTAGTAPATPSCTCRRNNGHVTTLSKNWTNPRQRPAHQGQRPPRRRGTARNAAQTQPAPPRRHRRRNPTTSTPPHPVSPLASLAPGH